MLDVYIKRLTSSDQGTFGVLSCPSVGYSCFSIELPWRNNKVQMSCIPKGDYIVTIRNSPKFGIVFHVQNVEGRSYILFHSMNYAGDTNKGWRTHSHGCIGLGKSKGILNGQMAILNSRLAITEFQRIMQNKQFKLHVI